MSLEESVTDLQQYFADRLNAGLPLTLVEWEALSDINRTLWEQALAEHQFKMLALQSYYLVDTIKGGKLAVETVWDILPEDVQEMYLKQWAAKDANKQNQ